MSSAGQPVQVTVTAPTAEEARQLARVAVEERLAACAQVTGPVASVYRWEGEVTEASEWVCVFKTEADCVDALARTVRAVHSYEVPEILVTPVVGGDPDYLAWVATETSPGTRDDDISPG